MRDIQLRCMKCGHVFHLPEDSLPSTEK